ncbi:UDP-glucoronosyl and UDP-glucosyl transferase [Novymonas esmeraldas]|uniref:UDP-glucoronosyl and UDP-glucosyl transferase n=1 Tax=Novymonas esmeraldas TaxID=1808958 RepID=A0AAW0EP87_9TRYP
MRADGLLAARWRRLLPLLLLVLAAHVVQVRDAAAAAPPHAASAHPPSRPWQQAPSAPSLYRTAEEVPRLHLAVMSVPLWGHFKPLWATAEEMAHRGHTVTCVVETVAWCNTLLRHSRHTAPLTLANMSAATAFAEPQAPGNGPLDIRCVVVQLGGEVYSKRMFREITSEGTSFIASLQRLIDDTFKHHELSLPVYARAAEAIHAGQPITTFLCDVVTYGCAAVARKMDLPIVNGFPLTTQLPVGLQAMLPAVGLGFPRHMTVGQRVINFLFKFCVAATAANTVRSLNRVRATHGAPPLRDGYDVVGMYGPIIAPTLWGLDIPHPLCPNVHQVGPLNTRDQRQPFHRQDLPLDLAAFMDGCPQGVVYANWGTLGAPAPEVEDRLHSALVDAAPLCVVWKRRTARTTAQPSTDGRLYVTSWLPSPMAVLKHPNTRVFVTHCGDTSTLEAIEAAVPLVGFPLFADQADVCQRVTEAGIGHLASATKHLTRDGVVAAIAAVLDSHGAMVQRLNALRAVAAVYGGPARAADIIESRQYNLLIHQNTTLEVCSALQGPLRIEYALCLWCAVLAAGALTWAWVLQRACARWLPVSAALSVPRRAARLLKGRRAVTASPPPAQAAPRPYKPYKQP